ncbi:single-stranded DNA-binding protein [Pseudoclavibacter helvolus]|uniref:Single-stranded DNA-binding protein n=2 Tax=Pseudoclavibacter helvolus TaxID=255205 RepID=A0A7W4YF18_9MICO|nr:single-stranded DNA-binding protein [Pseudoclavibacter helvolus]MBB2957812.1 single-strand DNA-binding protein [Pseudoclavibacter helvolus]
MQDHITLIGNLGSEPEAKTTTSGQQVVNFRIATNSRRLNRATNTWEDVDPNWYDVSAWGDLARHAASSFRKGQRVIVVGKLRMRKFDSQNGPRTKHEVVADALGHDLTAGTSIFAKLERAPREQASGETRQGFDGSKGFGRTQGSEGTLGEAPPEEDGAAAPPNEAEWHQPSVADEGEYPTPF